MASTSIEWASDSINFTTGCTHISDECQNCYAEKITNIRKGNKKFKKYREGFDVVVEHPHVLSQPYNWKKSKTVFVNSMSDLFHKDVSLDFIKKVFKVMNDTPQHTYLVLTKRHKKLEEYSNEFTWSDNIWAGVSVGNQVATRRIESLVKCGAKQKFLSVEPLIEQITDINVKGIDFVIAGGESGGNEARPLEKDWVLKIQEACVKENVPFFFKQWGKARNNPNPNDPTMNKLHRYYSKGGSQLDGKVYWENPAKGDDAVPTIDLFGEEYLVMDEIDDLVTIWELKSHLPFSDGELYKKLKSDIQKNGLNDPILYITTPDDKKLVIEGHTRLRALIELKREDVLTKEITEQFNSLDEVKLWMVKHQLQRRNLTTFERVNLAYLSKPTIEKLAKENLSKAGKSFGKNGMEENESEIQKIDTNEEIAKIAGVGRTTVVRYSQVLNYASQTTLNKLQKGDISIGSAYVSIENKIRKEKPVIKRTMERNVIILESELDASEALTEGTIDMILKIRSVEDLEVLKCNTKQRVGVVIIKAT